MRELADRPEEVPAVFAERFNSGDATALAQVYEDAAVLVPQPGTPATGPDLHAANGRLQKLGVPISVRPRHVYRSGDLALLIVDWVIDGTGREGQVVHVEGTATDIARRGPLDISETEAYAVRLRGANTVHVPGLLQTSEHAMAIFRAVVPQLPEHEVALRLAHRSERQSVITRDNPVPYVAVIHEAALRMQFGGREVARGQLKYLLEVSEWDNVTVLVLPFDQGAFPGAGQTVVYAEGPVRQLDTVQIDNSHGPDFLHSDGQLAKYRAQLDLLEGLALSPERSRDFIREIAHQL